MKKFLILTVVLASTLVGKAQQFQAEQFLSDTVAGITISNAAAAPFGGFTNIASWLSTANSTLVGTNALNLTWTNSQGIWVIPTNAALGTVSGIAFVTNNSSALVRDVPLWTDKNGMVMFGNTVTNTVAAGGEYGVSYSPQTLSIKMWGAASAATALNLIFVGLADGVNEQTGANGAPLTFQWGVVPAAGTVVVSTNFPSWKFAGCKTLRLRSASLTTTTAANIGVTIQSLSLNGFKP